MSNKERTFEAQQGSVKHSKEVSKKKGHTKHSKEVLNTVRKCPKKKDI